jgi:hypothetical protein
MRLKKQIYLTSKIQETEQHNPTINYRTVKKQS